MRTLLGLVFSAFLVSCGATPRGPGQATLRVIAEPENAVVEVDERFVGSARVLSVRPHALRSGAHRLTVRSPGFFPHDLDVDLPPGETVVRISLRAEPD